MDSIEYKGYTIEIENDENPDNPRNWDNLSHMVCFHKRYDLGDSDTDLSSDIFNGWEEVEEHLRKEKGAVIIAPLYLYDHSWLRIKIGSFYGCGLPQGHARFDSGQVGFIYVTKEDIKEDFQVKRITQKIKDRAMKVLEGEVKTYDSYVSGQVYGYRILDNKENDIDSCWGYYGDTDYLIQEAKGHIDYIIEHERKEKQKKVKSLIKTKVNLQYRKV